SFNRLSLAASGTRDSWEEQEDRAAELRLRLKVSALLSLGPHSGVEAALDSEHGTRREATDFSVRWVHDWYPVFVTEGSWRYGDETHRFDVGLAARDAFREGLNFDIGYGLILKESSIRHRFSAGVSYTWVIPIDVPEPVVKAFGGRETGSITGKARIVE